MQLNVYVPREKADVIERLDEAARRTGRRKNELVLEALQAYLGGGRIEIGSYDLGAFAMPSRADLYDEAAVER